MKLSQKAIDEFKAIYQGEVGTEITDEEAQKMAFNVLRVFQILFEPPEQASSRPSGGKIDTISR